MKILQINKFYFNKGGSERHLLSLESLLEKRGHKTSVFSMHHEKNLASPQAEYFCNHMDMHKFSPRNIIKFFYNYEATSKLKKLIEKEKPDIAHLHNIAHQLSPAIIKVLKKNNIRVIQTLHDYKIICPNFQLYNKTGNCRKCFGGKYYNCFKYSCLHNSRSLSFLGMLEAYLHQRLLKSYSQVDVFIAPSLFVKEAHVLAGIPERKIKVIRNFLGQEWLEAKMPEAEKEGNYFLYFGRLSKEKGIDVLVDAVAHSRAGLELKIAGDGPHGKSLRNKIAGAGLQDKIQMLGHLETLELMDLIKGAKAVVIPSLWPENMPYALLEAMAMGKLVVVSDVGGLPEALSNGKNGFVFEAGNRKNLGSVLEKIQKMSNSEAKIIKSSAKETVSFYDENYYYREIIKIYNN